MRDFTPQTARQLVGRDDGRVLEIGANDGEDTQRFLDAFPTGTIHCFEPDPRAIARWRARIHDSRATLHEMAICERTGLATLYLSGGTPPGECWKGYGEWDKSNSVLPFDRHGDNAPWMECGKQTIECPCMTLDDWASHHPGSWDFAWIDVQGAEGLVIRGGQETFHRIRYAFLECDPRPNYRDQAKLRELRAVMTRLRFKYRGQHAGFNHLWENRHFDS